MSTAVHFKFKACHCCVLLLLGWCSAGKAPLKFLFQEESCTSPLSGSAIFKEQAGMSYQDGGDAPSERPRLKLAPRTGNAPAAGAPATKVSSCFGGCKKVMSVGAIYE